MFQFLTEHEKKSLKQRHDYRVWTGIVYNKKQTWINTRRYYLWMHINKHVIKGYRILMTVLKYIGTKQSKERFYDTQCWMCKVSGEGSEAIK